MKKTTISVLLAMSLCPVTAFTSMAAGSGEYKAEDGTIYEYTIRKERLCIDKIFPGENTDTLNIPQKIDGVPVYRVSHQMNGSFDGIKHVNIPEGVEDIYFKDFVSLEEIDIPSSVSTLKSSCFSGCTSLKNAVLPDGMTMLDSSCFYDCTSLTSITIPSSVTIINNNAFCGCTSLEEVNWNRNAEMGTNVFDGTKYLRDGKDGLLLINNDTVLYAVMGHMKTVEIPESVTEVYQYAFMDSEVEKVIWPKSLKTIEINVFNGAKNLKEVEFKGEIDEIEACAFADCTSLTSAVIPKGVTEVPWGCFLRCKSMKTADIPAEVTVISDGAFAECSGLERIELHEGLETIGASAFSECPSLKEVTVPSTVKSIKEYAFEKCSSLARLDIKGAAVIGMAAFCETALDESNITLAEGVVYTPVKENKRYKNDPLKFLYAEDSTAVEENVHTPKVVENDEETSEKQTVPPAPTPKPTEKPEQAVPPASTPEPTEKPEQTAENKPAVIEVTSIDDEIQISIDDEAVQFTDAKPFIDESNRTQMPVRAVSEGIGMTVEYDDIAKEVSIAGKDTAVLLTIGSQDMIVNGETVKMDTAARIVNDRTYIPIRFVAEALGFDVVWN